MTEDTMNSEGTDNNGLIFSGSNEKKMLCWEVENPKDTDKITHNIQRFPIYMSKLRVQGESILYFSGYNST